MMVKVTEHPPRILALFDFDGTITTRDTLLELIKFKYGHLRFWLGLAVLSPVLALMMARVVSAQRAKEIMLSFFFGNITEARFVELSNRFTTDILSGLIRSKALEKLQWHQSQGHQVVIVSASAGHWIRPWAQHFQVEVIASELQVANGRITGRLETPNCNGEEKVRRIQQEFPLKEYKAIFAYGNSRGDLPMLKQATNPFYKSF